MFAVPARRDAAPPPRRPTAFETWILGHVLLKGAGSNTEGINAGLMLITELFPQLFVGEEILALRLVGDFAIALLGIRRQRCSVARRGSSAVLEETTPLRSSASGCAGPGSIRRLRVPEPPSASAAIR